MSQDPIKSTLITLDFFERGVVPLAATWRATATAIPCSYDINAVLKDLPPEEARAMRRRFRKLWRNIARRAAANGGKKSMITVKQLGLGRAEPSKLQKVTRKMCVLREASKRAAERAGGL